MRLILMLLVIGVATPSLAEETPRPAAFVNAETCLRDKAASAVAASSGATDAAEFLLTYLCATPVAAAANYQRNTASLRMMKQMVAGMPPAPSNASDTATVSVELVDDEGEYSPDAMRNAYEAASVDPVTGDMVFPQATDGGMGASLAMASANQALFSDKPIFLRELAGRLILEQHR